MNSLSGTIAETGNVYARLFVWKMRLEYTPLRIAKLGAPEISISGVTSLQSRAIVRRVKITGVKIRGESLIIQNDSLPLPLTISCDSLMTFGPETRPESVTAKKYMSWVIEIGDLIDVVILPQTRDAFPIESFWIRIEYVGTPSGTFSRKEDGHFAMRTKAGEKAERIVARYLRDKLGHSFPVAMCESPGFFEIRYRNKRVRQPDRTCLACDLTFEVKKRNKDEHFRVSHSNDRPWESENLINGWHAFVFADMKPRFVSNAMISQAIADERFTIGTDKYDSWAQIDPKAVTIANPPKCTG